MLSSALYMRRSAIPQFSQVLLLAVGVFLLAYTTPLFAQVLPPPGGGGGTGGGGIGCPPPGGGGTGGGGTSGGGGIGCPPGGGGGGTGGGGCPPGGGGGTGGGGGYGDCQPYFRLVGGGGGYTQTPGPPIPDDNWLITATYSGNLQSMLQEPNDPTLYTEWFIDAQGQYMGSNANLNLASVNNNPSNTMTGGITTSFEMTQNYDSWDQNFNASLQTSGANVQFVLQWQPANANAPSKPPTNVTIFYRRASSVSVGARLRGITPTNNDDVASANGLSSFPGISSASATAVTGSDGNPGSQDYEADNSGDDDFIVMSLPVSNGFATFSLPFNASLQLTGSSSEDPDYYYDDPDFPIWPDKEPGGTAVVQVDFCVAGFDLSRFGSRLKRHSAGHTDTVTDPSYTRWLPLSFSPQINSQPIRAQQGAWPLPFGNINCFYSMNLQQEPTTPNSDLDGLALLYRPSAGNDGTYNAPTGPYTTIPGSFAPRYALTDANSDRLVWDAAWTSNGDVLSQIQTGAGVLQLVNAGPPGALRQKGTYTYTFQVVSQNPLYARLVSIADNLTSPQYPNGNQQTLFWNDGGDPFLTVTDATSGRKLLFHAGGNGYLGSVDAPTADGTGVFTHTTTIMDTLGHLTSVNVFAPGASVPLHTDQFGYGGPNGDSVTTTQQGFATSTYSYIGDGLTQDAFGQLIPRLSSATYGSGSDTSSSDDGASVQGTYVYNYGPGDQGYNTWGPSNYINAVTDPLGHMFWSQFTLSGSTSGNIDGEMLAGPHFVGAAVNTNHTFVTYTPSIANPTLITVLDPVGFANSTPPWQASFDATSGNLLSTTDPLGGIWHYGYDPDSALLTQVTDPTSLKVSYQYNERGNPPFRVTSVDDNVGLQRLVLDYNVFGQLSNATRPGFLAPGGQDAVVQYSYNLVTGDLTKITYPQGDVSTVNAYDALGDPLSSSLYPDTGNPATSQSVLTTQVTYDAAQMPIMVTDPMGTQMQTSFTNGIPTRFQVVNPAWNGGAPLSQINLSYDTRGRVYHATDLLGPLADYRYDKAGNKTKIIDGAGNLTKFTYGANSEPLGTYWPDNHHTTLTYDVGGRLATSLDERGNLCDYLYDACHRLTDLSWPNDPAQNIHYTYDIAGRVLTQSDASGNRSYSYDPQWKRLTDVITVLAGLPAPANTYTVHYDYNLDGTLADVVTPVGVTSYGYDIGARLTSLTSPSGDQTVWQYDHAGRIIHETTTSVAGTTIDTATQFGNGAPSIFVSSLNQTVNGQPLESYTLQHTPLGQILTQNEQGNQPNQSGFEDFTYDTRGRLSSETDHYQPNANTNFDAADVYAYDAANNLLGGLGGWSYNSSNQLTHAPNTGGAPSTGGINTLSYDASGNVVAADGQGFSYNEWGDMTSAGTAVYSYDGAGRRVSKTVNGTTTYFLYDGDALIAEVNAAGSILHSYTWGAQGLISDRVNGGSGPSSRFYLYDGMDDTRTLLDTNGNVLQSAAYTAFGSPLTPSLPNTPFGWKGRFGTYYDAESGLYQMGARYYAASIGRFLQRDPSGFGAGPNLYAYCGDDPVNLVDLTGCDANHPLYSNSSFGDVANGIDDTFMGGSTKSFGTAVGRYDSGKISGWEVAWEGTKWGVQLALTAFGVYDAGKILYDIGKVGLECAMRGGCFVADTPVQMAGKNPDTKAIDRKTAKQSKKRRDATASTSLGDKKSETGLSCSSYAKAIQDVKQGDTVVSRNPRTGLLETRKVEKTTVRTVDAVVTVALANKKSGKIEESITATREHPFFVEGKGFVAAGGLAVGNAIVTRAGPSLIVKAISWHRRPEGYKVYNFVVEGDHTYFVGKADGGVWVHNACPLPGADEAGQLSLFTPEEPFDRMKQYGRTPNTAQKGSVPAGMLFDHDPALVQHYYEGDGAGGIPGYMMTQADREAYGKAVDAGKAATRDQRFSQGGTLRGYAIRMRKYWFGY